MTECFHCDLSWRCKCPFCSPGYEIFEGEMRVATGDCIAPFHGKGKAMVGAGPVIVPMTFVELQKYDRETLDYLKLYSGSGNSNMVDQKNSQYDNKLRGIRAEYAVLKFTGGKRTYNPKVRGADKGWDIVAEDGTKIEVKGTKYPNGHFLPAAHDQKFYADIGFLVVDGPGDGVSIVGGFTAMDWEAHKEKRDFGQGKGMQWCLNQWWMGDPRRFFLAVYQ